MAIITNNSTATFDFLRSRFKLTQSLDAHGKTTITNSDMQVFGFDYVTKSGVSLGNVVVSLLDDNESENSLKVYFGKDVSSANGKEQKDFYEFLTSLRVFAKSHMLGFDVRDINRNKLTSKSMQPMFESQFGSLDGSVRTSRQPLDTLKLIIKHSDRVNPESRGARSRKIERIYLANDKGERFLLPFKNLRAARAMARHVSNGGTPYDSVAQALCNQVDEVSCLSKFLRVSRAESSDPVVQAISDAVQIRVNEIKKLLASLNSQGGYTKNSSSLVPQEIISTSLEVPELNGISENLENEMPYVLNVLRGKKNMLKESREFKKWVLVEDE